MAASNLNELDEYQSYNFLAQHGGDPKKDAAAREDAATTKAINQKNEVAIAAKAVAVGTRFFLSNVASQGEKEMKKQMRECNKKQSKGGGAKNRLKAQLRKLGRTV